ncbi:MAG: PAS domain S-box protein [Bacteroidetes bacterium]|nr:PAS domain S-box protein [Bacteroidota bacterium]
MIRFKFIHDLSIKNKIIVIILSLIFLIHTIGFIFITIWDIKRIQTGIQTGLVLNTKLIANNCVVPLMFGDDQQATEALSHLKNIEFIEKGCLFDKEGNIFATYPDTLNKKAFSVFPEQQNNILKNGFFYVHEPVMFQNEKYGALFIKANSKPLKTAKKNIILTLILLSIVLDVLSIFLASKMQKYISKPIINLKNHFDQIAENQDFSNPILKINNDEIGSLYDGFNNMLNHIYIRQNERNNAKKLLIESEKKYRGLYDSIRDAIMVGNTDKKIIECNQAFSDLFEYSFKEIKDTEIIILYENEKQFNEFSQALKSHLGNTSHFLYTVNYKKKNGLIFTGETTIYYLNDSKGNTIGFIGLIRDITDIKKAEIVLKKHHEELEKLVQERTKELEEKNMELEQMNNVFVDREFRIKELREKLDSLTSDK